MNSFSFSEMGLYVQATHTRCPVLKTCSISVTTGLSGFLKKSLIRSSNVRVSFSVRCKIEPMTFFPNTSSSRISKKPLCKFIEENDIPFDIDTHNDAVGIFDEVPVLLFTFAESLKRPGIYDSHRHMGGNARQEADITLSQGTSRTGHCPRQEPLTIPFRKLLEHKSKTLRPSFWPG